MAKLKKLATVASIVASLVSAIALLWNVYVFQKTSDNNEAVLNATIDRQNKVTTFSGSPYFSRIFCSGKVCFAFLGRVNSATTTTDLSSYKIKL